MVISTNPATALESIRRSFDHIYRVCGTKGTAGNLRIAHIMLRPRWHRRSFFVVCQSAAPFVMDDRPRRRWSVPPANPAPPFIRRESFSLPESLLEWKEAHCEQGHPDRQMLQ